MQKEFSEREKFRSDGRIILELLGGFFWPSENDYIGAAKVMAESPYSIDKNPAPQDKGGSERGIA